MTQKISLPVLQYRDPAALDEPLSLPSTPILPEGVRAFERIAMQTEGRPFRTSGYVIYVDLPDQPEEVLLVHGYTGAHDKVSRQVATYLRALEPGPPPGPLHGAWSPEPEIDGVVTPPSDAVIETLKKRGYLTRLEEREEEELFASIGARLHLRSLRAAPSYVLMPTYQCNLRCAYCFQDHMRTDPAYAHLLRVMQPEMIDRIFEGMRQIEAAHGLAEGGESARRITLLGGEPLLAESRPTIESIIRKAQSFGKVVFTAITNATELDAYEDLLGPDGISSLQVTIDGPPAEHDRRRIYADGSGSFERIARNVTMALARGAQVQVRMNVDRGNLWRLPRLVAELTARGWTEHAKFHAYVAPVHSANDHTDARTTFNTWQLNQAMAQLRSEDPSMARIHGQDDGLLTRARGIFKNCQDSLPGFKGSFCSAHSNMYVIDAFGDIYACWERTGDPSIRVGAIGEGGEVRMNRAHMDSWRHRSVISNPVCRKCRYAAYCGGGCAVLPENQQGILHANHCDAFGKRLRASIGQAFQDHLSGVKQEDAMEMLCDA